VRQGSQEVDVAQLMRDLTDSLERENDLKEQLRFSEEETKVMRKKLSDIEDENESLTMQVRDLYINMSRCRIQWRRQDLLRGGAKLEGRSSGTHGELQGRVQPLLLDYR